MPSAAGARAKTPHETTTSPRKKKQHSELGKQLVAPLQSPGVLRRVALELDIGHFRGRQSITCVEFEFRAPHALRLLENLTHWLISALVPTVFGHHVRPKLEQATEHVMQALARGDVAGRVATIRRRIHISTGVDQSF